MTPLLSVCIPTYNRAGYLRDALESIALQFEDVPTLKEEVEIVIADNASTDDTEETALSFLPTFEHFRYIKNPTNVGFDGNVDIAVRTASGVYCWYLGDDDTIIRGALTHMLELCRDDRLTVIGLADVPLIDRSDLPGAAETYSAADHVLAASPSESYIRGYLPSALSMLAFRREAWLAAADFVHHTPGWFYFETILQMAVQPGAKVLYVRKPMVRTGQDMRWADNGAGLKNFIDCNRFLRKMTAWGYDKEIIARELAGNTRKFPRVLLQAKGRGLEISRANHIVMRNFTVHAPWHIRLASELIFLIPNPLVRFVRDLKKKLA